MQQPSTGKIYLAKQIEGPKAPKEITQVQSEGRLFRLNTMYRDNPDGLCEAKAMEAHLQRVCKGMTFAVLRLIRTPEGDLYERVPKQG